MISKQEPSTGAIDTIADSSRERRARTLIKKRDAAALGKMADAGMRHDPDAKMTHAVGAMLEIARAFDGATTRDGSWGELEKRFAVLAQYTVEAEIHREMLYAVIRDVALNGGKLSDLTLYRLRAWAGEYADS